MRALLIFYLVQHWLFSDAEASVVYGAYTALVYITPVVGGYLADKYLGQRKAVLFGAVLLTLGHFAMAFEGDGGQADPVINVFWLALALIIVGSGFLKANISVIVGQLYPRTDVRRDAGYTIFYMGINVGAATASIICGYLGQTYGWQYGFGLAGVGMLIGLIFFVLGKPLLRGRGEAKDPVKLASNVAGLKLEWWMYLAGIAMVALCWLAVQYQDMVGLVLLVFGGGLVAYVIFTAVVKLPSEERDRIFAALFLILTSIIFWALFEQAGSSLNLFTDRHVDRAGVEASMFQSINAIYIILLAPVFAALWQGLGRKGAEPSTPLKFGLGIVQVGLGFLVLVWGRTKRRHRRADAGDLHLPDLPAPHHGRAVPQPGRPVGDEPAGTGTHGLPHHGHVVLRLGHRQFRRRPDRGRHRGRGAGGGGCGQGAGAGRLFDRRLDRRGCRRRGHGRQPAGQAPDAPRHVARRQCRRRSAGAGAGRGRAAAGGHPPRHPPADLTKATGDA